MVGRSHYLERVGKLMEGVVGKTKTLGGKKEDTDLSLGTLLSDFVGVVEHLFPDPKEGPSLVVRTSQHRLADSLRRQDSCLVTRWVQRRYFPLRRYSSRKAILFPE